MTNKTKGAISSVLIALIAAYLGLNPGQLTSQLASEALVIEDYREAREIFWDELYPNGGETLYCAEKFAAGYHKHINIEHVFPMSWVAWTLNCGKRWQCRENSDDFNRIEADLHNLFPARADINEARRSHPFGMVSGEKRSFAKCDFEIDYKKRIIEPRPAVRGDIARAMFYMAQRYDLEIHDRQYQILQQWDKQDPVSETERQRNQAIKRLQGNANPFID